MRRLLLHQDLHSHCGYIIRADPGKLADTSSRVDLAFVLDGVDVADLSGEVLCSRYEFYMPLHKALTCLIYAKLADLP